MRERIYIVANKERRSQKKEEENKKWHLKGTRPKFENTLASKNAEEEKFRAWRGHERQFGRRRREKRRRGWSWRRQC